MPKQFAMEFIQPIKSVSKRLPEENDRVNRMLGNDDEKKVLTLEEHERELIMAERYGKYGVLQGDKKRVKPRKQTKFILEQLVVKDIDFDETHIQQALSHINGKYDENKKENTVF
jgi:hypothetical protein